MAGCTTVFSCGHTVCTPCTETLVACLSCGKKLDFKTAEPDTRGLRPRCTAFDP